VPAMRPPLEGLELNTHPAVFPLPLPTPIPAPSTASTIATVSPTASSSAIPIVNDQAASGTALPASAALTKRRIAPMCFVCECEIARVKCAECAHGFCATCFPVFHSTQVHKTHVFGCLFQKFQQIFPSFQTARINLVLVLFFAIIPSPFVFHSRNCTRTYLTRGRRRARSANFASPIRSALIVSLMTAVVSQLLLKVPAVPQAPRPLSVPCFATRAGWNITMLPNTVRTKHARGRGLHCRHCPPQQSWLHPFPSRRCLCRRRPPPSRRMRAPRSRFRPLRAFPRVCRREPLPRALTAPHSILLTLIVEIQSLPRSIRPLTAPEWSRNRRSYSHRVRLWRPLRAPPCCAQRRSISQIRPRCSSR
jgi:hypothetical protein